LFRPDEDDKKSLKFEKILEEKTWPSPDARGRRRLAGEASLLKHLHENTMFNKADDAWKASLVPKHCVVEARRRPSHRDRACLGSLPLWSVDMACAEERQMPRCSWIAVVL
jgi:hypothetical protein